MEYFSNLLLGSVIQGFTEALPISSSGHFLLLEIITSQTIDNLLFFVLFTHFATVLASISYFFVEYVKKNRNLNVFKFIKNINEEVEIILIVIALLPILFFGSILYEFIESINIVAILPIIFIVSGLVLAILDIIISKYIKIKTNKYISSFCIGLFQLASVFPGVSRLGYTILAGRIFQMDYVKASRFSFYLAIPTILGVNFFIFFSNYEKIIILDKIQLIVVFLISFIVFYISIYFLLKYINRIKLVYFGIYQLLLGIFLISLI